MIADDVAASLQCRCLSGLARAVEMEMLDFGARVERQYRNGTRTVGEFALHLTGCWRIVADSTVLVGYRDFWIPANKDEDDEDFDPEPLGASRRDRLMEAFLSHGEQAHCVQRVEVTPMSDLRVVFRDSCVLECFADLGFVVRDPSDPRYCWLLLQPGVKAPHVVVGPVGVMTER